MRSYGFLEVELCDDRIVRLDYAGNMGNTVEDSIAPAFDALYGEGAYDRIADKGWMAQDTQGQVFDDPSYLWIKKIAIEDWPFDLEGLTDV